MDHYRRELDSPAWIGFVKITWIVAVGATAAGILFMPSEQLWVKGYLAMGLLFCVGSTFSLAETVRDQHEATKLIRKLDDAKTEMILKDHAA